MENKALPMPVVIGIIVAAVLIIGFFGWNAVNGHRTGANGVDLSQAAVQPSSAAGVGSNHK